MYGRLQKKSNLCVLRASVVKNILHRSKRRLYHRGTEDTELHREIHRIYTMWTCPLCNQSFTRINQAHSCNEKQLEDFLRNKSVHTVALFRHFIQEYNAIAPVTIHPTKTMIGISAGTRIAWITRLGKDFVDIMFPFMQRYDDNLCFHKMAQVPGGQQCNHYFRMMREEDVNEEVKKYMKLAWDNGQS